MDSADLHIALRYAVVSGKLDIVRAILEDTRRLSSSSLEMCGEQNSPRDEELTIILPPLPTSGQRTHGRFRISVGECHNRVVREAIEMGHEEVALYLLGDPSISIEDSTRVEDSLLCCAIRASQTGKTLDTLVQMATLRPGAVNRHGGAAMRTAIELCDKTAALKLLEVPDICLSTQDVSFLLQKFRGMAAARILPDKRFSAQVSMIGWKM